MKIATGVAVIGGIVAGAISASAALNLPTMSCSYMFNSNMKLGSRGTDVMNLQKDRKSTRLNSSHLRLSRMPSSA